MRTDLNIRKYHHIFYKPTTYDFIRNLHVDMYRLLVYWYIRNSKSAENDDHLLQPLNATAHWQEFTSYALSIFFQSKAPYVLR